VFVAAKPRQANRCWPRAYLIPPGIILILVSHAFDPTYCNPRYRAPVTLLLPLWARRSKDDCARSSSCRHYIHTSSLQQRNKTTHRTLARNESNRRPGRGGPLLLRPYAWRRGQACATCGLSDLSIREHKHFTALCPPPQEAALQQAGRRIVARRLLRCCWICTCCYNLADHDDKHARGPPQRRRLRGRLVECWDKVRVQAIEQQHRSTAAHSGGLGRKAAAPPAFPSLGRSSFV
jgi:hypothetical protein